MNIPFVFSHSNVEVIPISLSVTIQSSNLRYRNLQATVKQWNINRKYIYWMGYAKSPSFIPVCLQDLNSFTATSRGGLLDELRNGKGRAWPNQTYLGACLEAQGSRCFGRKSKRATPEPDNCNWRPTSRIFLYTLHSLNLLCQERKGKPLKTFISVIGSVGCQKLTRTAWMLERNYCTDCVNLNSS